MAIKKKMCFFLPSTFRYFTYTAVNSCCLLPLVSSRRADPTSTRCVRLVRILSPHVGGQVRGHHDCADLRCSRRKESVVVERNIIHRESMGGQVGGIHALGPIVFKRSGASQRVMSGEKGLHAMLNADVLIQGYFYFNVV